MRALVRIVSVSLSLLLLAACSGGGSSPAPFGGAGGGGASGTGGNGAPPSSPTPSPAGGSAPLVPASGSIYLGAYVNAYGGGSDASSIARFEGQIGRKLALSLHYRGWTKPFPTADEEADAAAGRIPVISWECGTTDARVASGAEDATIVARADALRAFGKPVFLRYKWEMNLPGGPNDRAQCVNPADDSNKGFFSAPDFVAAWNHIHAIFVARGATNVAFLWNPSGGSSVAPAAYYPGNASVDWVGIDQYDRSNEAFVATYDLYPEVAAYGKPIIIAETAANPAYQTAFLAAAAAGLATSLPQVKGFIYFDAPGNFSWTLTAQGVTAFAAMSHAPYLSAFR